MEEETETFFQEQENQLDQIYVTLVGDPGQFCVWYNTGIAARTKVQKLMQFVEETMLIQN